MATTDSRSSNSIWLMLRAAFIAACALGGYRHPLSSFSPLGGLAAGFAVGVGVMVVMSVIVAVIDDLRF